MSTPTSSAHMEEPKHLVFDDLVALIGGWRALDDLALAAISKAMQGHSINRRFTDDIGTWAIEGELTDASADFVHSIGPTTPVTAGFGVHETLSLVAVEANVTARLRGQVTRLDHVDTLHDPSGWVVDTPIDLYVGGAITVDLATRKVTSTTIAIAGVGVAWDLSVTGLHQLANWGTFDAYEPPWSLRRGGTGEPPSPRSPS